MYEIYMHRAHRIHDVVRRVDIVQQATSPEEVVMIQWHFNIQYLERCNKCHACHDNVPLKMDNAALLLGM